MFGLLHSYLQEDNFGIGSKSKDAAVFLIAKFKNRSMNRKYKVRFTNILLKLKYELKIIGYRTGR